MWKKHPLAHFVLGLALALFLGFIVILTIPLGIDFLADSHNPPVVTEGRVTFRFPPQLRSGSGGFELRTDQNQYQRFDIAPRLLEELSRDDLLRVYHSPQLHHVYYIEFVNTPGKRLWQDHFEPEAFYQPWQAPIFWLMVGVGVTCLGALGYSLIALSDWLLPLRRVQGVLVARIEQADNSAAGYALMLRINGKSRNRTHRETCRFQVKQSDFLATDQADFVELEYTPIFKYVRRLRILHPEDFTPGEIPALEEGGPGRLRYMPGWHFKTFLYADVISAAALFGFACWIVITRFSTWFEASFDPQLYERYILPAMAIGAFMVSLYMGVRFWRKLRDLRAPKKLTVGPVLSKWRVTGVTNDMRRQIVVADGGLQAGGEGVRKFEVNGLLFDELKVGDLVEIEHSPRLRYIFRLEVTGHQELSKV